MKKLGLENKLKEENLQRIQELEKEVSYYKSLVAEKDALLEKKDHAIQSFMSGDIISCIDKHQTSLNSNAGFGE